MRNNKTYRIDSDLQCHFCNARILSRVDYILSNHMYGVSKFLVRDNQVYEQINELLMHEHCADREIGKHLISNVKYTPVYIPGTGMQEVKCFSCTHGIERNMQGIIYAIGKSEITDRANCELLFMGHIEFCEPCWQEMAGKNFP